MSKDEEIARAVAVLVDRRESVLRHREILRQHLDREETFEVSMDRIFEVTGDLPDSTFDGHRECFENLQAVLYEFADATAEMHSAMRALMELR